MFALPAVAVVVAALLVSVSLVGAVEDSWFVDRPTTCMASTQTAKRPRFALEFCYWYSDESCCVPGNDKSAREAFFAMVDLGPGCASSDHHVRRTYRELREFMCMGCHPKEPTYRFKEIDGDAVTPSNPNATADSFVWRVCSSFLYGKNEKSGLWGGDGHKYDDCGLNLPIPCDRFTQVSWDSGSGTFVDSGVPRGPPDADCGSDFIFPKAEYSTADSDIDTQRAAARTFMSVLPQWLPNFKFVIVNDSVPNFDYAAMPCFRGSNGALGYSVAVVIAATIALFLATSS